MLQLAKAHVDFDQESHTYTDTQTGATYSGITSTLLRRLFPDKYAGIPQNVLDAAASRGTATHEELELIDAIGITPDTITGRAYIAAKEREHLTPAATEYTVTDSDRYATNIDVVYDNGDGTATLADHKTTSKFDKDYVSWQLSICAYLFETCNPAVKVTRLIGIWHKDGRATVIDVPRQSDSDVNALMQADRNDSEFEYHSPVPAYLADREALLIHLATSIKALQEQYDTAKAEVLAAMSEAGDKSVDTGAILVTRVAPTAHATFDTKAFRVDHADLYKQYSRETETKESLKITLREN